MTTPLPNILLMGPRASGKTTIGFRLAQHLHRPFVDLDESTRASFGESGTIREIWRRFGEARWREAEKVALVRTLSTPGQVIALGGGTPTIEASRTLMLQGREAGAILPVYLQCDVEVLRQRLRKEDGGDGGDRPALLSQDAIEEVAQVLAAREPLYLELASMTVRADGQPDAVVSDLVSRLRRTASP